MLLQAAFELFAWTLLVEDKSSISRKSFESLPAAMKLRSLLSTCGIPHDVPSSLTSLLPLNQHFGWADGPGALVGLRNMMVHPTKSNNQKFAKASAHALFEASSLSFWYLELLLLWLFGFRGKYSNRLIMSGWKGDDVEVVPWGR
jgi:hypothetical protein